MQLLGRPAENDFDRIRRDIWLTQAFVFVVLANQFHGLPRTVYLGIAVLYFLQSRGYLLGRR